MNEKQSGWVKTRKRRRAVGLSAVPRRKAKMISKAGCGISLEMDGERKILRTKSDLINIRKPIGCGLKLWF